MLVVNTRMRASNFCKPLKNHIQFPGMNGETGSLTKVENEGFTDDLFTAPKVSITLKRNNAESYSIMKNEIWLVQQS